MRWSFIIAAMMPFFQIHLPDSALHRNKKKTQLVDDVRTVAARCQSSDRMAGFKYAATA